MTPRQLLFGIEGFVGGISERAAYADRIIVPQIAAHLAKDHGHCVGGKLYILSDIEIIDGLDKADTANLKQIVNIFLVSGKALDDT